jgi:predicted TIM-barrel fold metal-dependent hydrolase
MIHGRCVTPFCGRELDSLQKILASLDEREVERAVLVPSYSPEGSVAYATNKMILDVARKAPGVVIPGLWVDPSPRVGHLLSDTLVMARENNVRVLKTSAAAWERQYSPDPASWDPTVEGAMAVILDYVRDASGVLQIHSGSGKSDVRLIEKLIRYAGSGVRFHVVHMGNSAGGHFYLVPRLAEWLNDGLDVVCDTSWARGFAVRWIFEKAGSDPLLRACILFASDEPWGVFRSELAKVVDAALGDPVLLEAVLWDNAYSVYGDMEAAP